VATDANHDGGAGSSSWEALPKDPFCRCVSEVRRCCRFHASPAESFQCSEVGRHLGTIYPVYFRWWASMHAGELTCLGGERRRETSTICNQAVALVVASVWTLDLCKERLDMVVWL
jgi:hypothetical protein